MGVFGGLVSMQRRLRLVFGKSRAKNMKNAKSPIFDLGGVRVL